jgi:multidrug efflux pump subunit AcrA (membrane-fusion protein)
LARVWVLGLALTLLLSGSAPAAKDSPKAPAPAAAAPERGAQPDIDFKGKVFCSLKRQCHLLFKAIILEVNVKAGDMVRQGQVLARFKLTPESALQVQQRLLQPQVLDMEVKLAGLERSLIPLKNKQKELTGLVQQNLAPTQSLNQLNQEIGQLEKERQAMLHSLETQRRLAKEEQAVLQNQLGEAVTSGKLPATAALVAPIAGHVIWVHPDLQPEADVGPLPGAIVIGVMDPMVVRGQAFESEALDIKPGQDAKVILESLPGQQFPAKVSRVAWASLTPGLDQPSYYDVEMTVPNPQLLLKEGLKARIVIPRPTP